MENIQSTKAPLSWKKAITTTGFGRAFAVCLVLTIIMIVCMSVFFDDIQNVKNGMGTAAFTIFALAGGTMALGLATSDYVHPKQRDDIYKSQ